MPRYKLTIEYDGGPFVGWQAQAAGISVQQAIEAAVAGLGQAAAVAGAGRTDAGVHALGQVAHLDLDKAWRGEVLRNALNAHLRPHPISVLAVEEVAADFHARFTAIKRSYLYRIVCRPAPLALERGHAWWLPRGLDADAMHEAAQTVLGPHDFTTFRAAQCQAKSPVKTLDLLQVSRYGEAVEIRAEARSFLHNQVRSLVGSLKLVGEGRWPVRQMRAALDAKDRSRCGPVAPPQGLYLLRVDYPRSS